MFGLSIPLWIKVAAAGVVVAAGLGLYAYVASLKATIAEQRTEIVRTTAERDQEKVTAEGWRGEAAILEKRIAKEAAARDRERQALRSAIQSRDKIIDEARRAKDARDPMPDAWLPTFRRVP